MPRTAIVRVVTTMLVAGLLSLHAVAQDREKVEEGRYVLLRNKGEVPHTGHSWTLWRLLGGGYELEDRIESPPDALVMPLSALKTPGVDVRRRLLGVLHPSEFHLIYGPDWQLLSLTVSGAKADHDRHDALKCRADAKGLKCDGDDSSAKLTLDAARGFFWWYRIPMLLRPWLPSSSGDNTAPVSAKIAMLSFPPGPGVERTSYNSSWGDRPDLQPADLTIVSLGQAMLVLGDSTVVAQKYRLDFHPRKGERLSLIAWTDKRAILAVEDASLPGHLMALAAYKRYPDDAASTPAQPER
jgi:hypothetical protein